MEVPEYLYKYDTNDKWTKETEETARKLIAFEMAYKCDKCAREHCKHMLNARYKRFEKEIDEMRAGLFSTSLLSKE